MPGCKHEWSETSRSKTADGKQWRIVRTCWKCGATTTTFQSV